MEYCLDRRVDLPTAIAWSLLWAAVCVGLALLFQMAVGAVMLCRRCGFQEAATLLQTWGEATGEVAARSLKIAAGVALAVLIIYIGIKVFTS